MKKYEMLKKLDSVIEDLVELDDLEKEYEAACEFEDLILLTKFRMVRFFLELEKYSTDELVTMALKKQDGIIIVSDTAFENSHLLNESSDLMMPLERHYHEKYVC